MSFLYKLDALPMQDHPLLRKTLASMSMVIHAQITNIDGQGAFMAAHCVQPAMHALNDLATASTSSITTLHSLIEV